MTRCPDECEKKQKTGKQTKTGWQKQKEKEEKKEVRRLTMDKEITIVRIVAEKEEDLKVFEKKESERMLMRKTQDYVIDLREGFVPKKGKIYLLSRVEREEVQEFVRDQLRREYIRLSKSLQTLLVFFVPKKDRKKKDGAKLLVSKQLDNQE